MNQDTDLYKVTREFEIEYLSRLKQLRTAVDVVLKDPKNTHLANNFGNLTSTIGFAILFNDGLVAVYGSDERLLESRHPTTLEHAILQRNVDFDALATQIVNDMKNRIQQNIKFEHETFLKLKAKFEPEAK